MTGAHVDPTLPLPPGSMGLPWLGETLAWGADSFAFMDARAERHGPIFKTRLFGQPVVCCVGPEAVESFLDDRLVERAGASPPHLEGLIGTGTLPFVDGDLQRRNKRWMLTAFGDEAMEGYVRAAAPMVAAAAASWDRRGDFEWLPEIESLVLRVFDTLFTGADPDDADPDLRRDLDLFLAGVLALPLPFPWATYPRAARAKERLVARLRAVVDERAEQPGTDVITRLLAAPLGDGPAGHDQIAAEMLHLLFAGYGAMSAGLAFTVLALGREPGRAEEVRAELDSMLGAGPVSWAALERLEVTGRFWKEVLRMFPIVPQTLFGTVRRDFECLGYRVPAGWRATACIHASLQHAPSHPDPDTFDPTRFARPPSHPCAFVPQGGGPPDAHRCLGERPSEMLAKLVLAELLRGYRWDLVAPRGEIDRRAFPPRPVDRLAVRGFRARAGKS